MPDRDQRDGAPQGVGEGIGDLDLPDLTADVHPLAQARIKAHQRRRRRDGRTCCGLGRPGETPALLDPLQLAPLVDQGRPTGQHRHAVPQLPQGDAPVLGVARAAHHLPLEVEQLHGPQSMLRHLRPLWDREGAALKVGPELPAAVALEQPPLPLIDIDLAAAFLPGQAIPQQRCCQGLLFLQVPFHAHGRQLRRPGHDAFVHLDAPLRQEGDGLLQRLVLELPVPDLPPAHKGQQAQVGHQQHQDDDIFDLGPGHGSPSPPVSLTGRSSRR